MRQQANKPLHDVPGCTYCAPMRHVLHGPQQAVVLVHQSFCDSLSYEAKRWVSAFEYMTGFIRGSCGNNRQLAEYLTSVQLVELKKKAPAAIA